MRLELCVLTMVVSLANPQKCHLAMPHLLGKLLGVWSKIKVWRFPGRIREPGVLGKASLADAFSPPSGCTSLPRLVASLKSSIKQPWNVWGTAARRGGQGRPASLWKNQRINGTFLLSHLLPVLCWGPHIVTGMYWGSKHPGTCMSVGWLCKELGMASPPAGLHTPQICPKSQEDAGKCSRRPRVGLAGI